MATVREAVVELMLYLCNNDSHGYHLGDGRDWSDANLESVTIAGYPVYVPKGDTDCSGAVLAAMIGCGIFDRWTNASTLTMVGLMCDGVNFRWQDWDNEYVMRPGDLAIKRGVHVAMCVDSTFTLADFWPANGSEDENEGDQGGEGRVVPFYDTLGWEGCIEMMDALGNQTWVGPNHEYRLASGGSSGGSASASITEDGYWGPDTTRAMQAHYGTYVDGIVSHQWEPNVAANSEVLLRSSWEGDYTATGSPMIRALQADIGTEQDGIFGEADIVKIKSDLFAGVYGTAGTMDRATVWQIQHQLNGGVWPLRL